MFHIIALTADLSRLRLTIFWGPGEQTKPASPGWVSQLSPVGHQAIPVQNAETRHNQLTRSYPDGSRDTYDP